MTNTVIQLEEFNSCPGSAEVGQRLGKLLTLPGVAIEDSPYDYWKNCNDTLVVSLDKNIEPEPAFIGWLQLLVELGKLQSDEIDSIYNAATNKFYVRLWWD